MGFLKLEFLNDGCSANELLSEAPCPQVSKQLLSLPTSESHRVSLGGSGVMEGAVMLRALALVTEGQAPSPGLQGNKPVSTQGLQTQEKLPIPPDRFSRQEYWSWLPFPSPGDLPIAGIERASPMSLALAAGFFSTSTTWEVPSRWKSQPVKRISG